MSKSMSLAVLSLLCACAGPAPQRLVDGRGETGAPALHAIQDRQLRVLMGRMDSLMQERFMTETQLDDERRKYARKIAGAAENLAITVDKIIESLPSLSLTADEQVAFLALAQKLRTQARQLQQVAVANRLATVNKRLREINSTCTSCHALFRETGR
ncbi:MAG: hypothetical protein Kow0065_04710 [Methylomicrobium sp.]